MLFSKSNFFKQSRNTLIAKRYDVYSLLLMKGYSRKQTDVYLNAYDYFCENKEAFDGATLVKDLIDIKGLDLDAMLHDYQYLNHNVGSNIKTKLLADLLYAKGIERKGKSQYAAYSRFIGLTIAGLIITIYSLIKRGFISKDQKNNFIKEYETLSKKNNTN